MTSEEVEGRQTKKPAEEAEEQSQEYTQDHQREEAEGDDGGRGTKAMAIMLDRVGLAGGLVKEEDDKRKEERVLVTEGREVSVADP